MNENSSANGSADPTGSRVNDKMGETRDFPISGNDKDEVTNVNNGHELNGSCNNVKKNNTTGRVIDCLSWNIEGLLEKLNTDDFLEFLYKFDILILGETFTLPSFNFDIKFSDYFCVHNPAKKYNRLGRPSGGIVL